MVKFDLTKWSIVLISSLLAAIKFLKIIADNAVVANSENARRFMSHATFTWLLFEIRIWFKNTPTASNVIAKPRCHVPFCRKIRAMINRSRTMKIAIVSACFIVFRRKWLDKSCWGTIAVRQSISCANKASVEILIRFEKFLPWCGNEVIWMSNLLFKLQRWSS